MEQNIKLELMKCGLLYESDENIDAYIEILQEEKLKRSQKRSLNRKLDRLKREMDCNGFSFINGETGEILENVTIC
jgi:hypothetical protein